MTLTTTKDRTMPFRYDCDGHPDWTGGHPVDATAHAEEHHGGSMATIHSQFVSQVEAQGGTAIRIFGCRTCGVRVTTTDGEREPYCDEHLS